MASGRRLTPVIYWDRDAFGIGQPGWVVKSAGDEQLAVIGEDRNKFAKNTVFDATASINTVQAQTAKIGDGTNFTRVLKVTGTTPAMAQTNNTLLGTLVPSSGVAVNDVLIVNPKAALASGSHFWYAEVATTNQIVIHCWSEASVDQPALGWDVVAITI